MLYAGGQNPKKREGLTNAQRARLEEVRTAGVKVYNGRAGRLIKELERRGLVTVEWDHIPQAKGGGIELVQRITVRPRGAR